MENCSTCSKRKSNKTCKANFGKVTGDYDWCRGYRKNSIKLNIDEKVVIDRNIKIHFKRGISKAVLNIMLQDMEKMINEKYCYLTEKEMASEDYQEYLLKLVIRFI